MSTKEQEITKMEFLMTLNDNIVVQRFFNVRNYNPKAKNSMEFYDYFKGLGEKLQYDLKMKSVIYLLDNKHIIEEDPSVMNTSYTDGEEVFNMYVKVGDHAICHRNFDAKVYPPKVRYTVDVRPEIKAVLKELTDIFSSENLTTQYLNISL
jgi:hypothetical protein